MNHTEILNKFLELYSNQPLIVKAPGRINLIGEHTDYNDGFVLPATIDKNIFFAIQKNKEKLIRVHAFNFNDSISVPVKNIVQNEKEWVNYILGPYVELLNKGHELEGFDCVFGGDIPVGAGLSSSAAIESGLIYGLNSLFNLGLKSLQIARLAQKAEHHFAGVNCGIMDQFAITHGINDHVIKLDCRSLEASYYPFNLSDKIIILVNSNVKHNLATSEYNTRRSECTEGVEQIKQHFPDVTNLRDVSLNQIMQVKDLLDTKIYNRCLYVIEENIRVADFCEALSKEDFSKAGELMHQSHLGLQHKYEVSCPELDFLVHEAMQLDYVLGSRMMGGGFGGCTINLVYLEDKESFINTITKKYMGQSGIKPDIYTVQITNGLEIINKK